MICPVVLSLSVHLFSHLFCFKCAQDTVRHGTSVIEWLFCTLKLHWNRFFLYLNTKQILLFACQNMLHLSLSKVHSQNVHTVTTNVNITAHIKMVNINVTVHINKH